MRLRQKTAEGQSEAQAYRRLPFTSPVQGYLDNPGCGLRSIADSGTITNYFTRASARGRGGSSAGRRSEKADRRLAWRSCRRIPCATPGKKAHFCDRHHIAGATAALTSHSSGTAVWYSLSIIPPELSPANAGLLCVHTPAIEKHSGGPGYHPTNGWGVGGIRGWVMNNVLSLRLARERA